MDNFASAVQLTSLTLFLILFIARVVYLRSSRGVNVFTLGHGKRGITWLVEVLFLPVFLAWFLEVVLYALHSSFRLFPAPLDHRLLSGQSVQMAGLFCFMAALGLFCAALVAFGTSWRVGIDEDKPGDLVSHGIFALSRNPIFVCLDLYVLGAFLVNGSLIFLLFAALTMIGIHGQILQEERFLHSRYGSAYSNYCRQTGRYFGWQVPGAVAPKGSN